MMNFDLTQYLRKITKICKVSKKSHDLQTPVLKVGVDRELACQIL